MHILMYWRFKQIHSIVHQGAIMIQSNVYNNFAESSAKTDNINTIYTLK